MPELNPELDLEDFRTNLEGVYRQELCNNTAKDAVLSFMLVVTPNGWAVVFEVHHRGQIAKYNQLSSASRAYWEACK